eukprot:CFRG5212T1
MISYSSIAINNNLTTYSPLLNNMAPQKVRSTTQGASNNPSSRKKARIFAPREVTKCAVCASDRNLSKRHALSCALPDCRRTYHTDCVGLDSVPIEGDCWVCVMHETRYVLPQELSKSLTELITHLTKLDVYRWFSFPVDIDQMPDYYSIISTPMDLMTMREKVEQGAYRSVNAFLRDYETIMNNATTYNPATTIYHDEAQFLRTEGVVYIHKSAPNLGLPMYVDDEESELMDGNFDHDGINDSLSGSKAGRILKNTTKVLGSGGRNDTTCTKGNSAKKRKAGVGVDGISASLVPRVKKKIDVTDNPYGLANIGAYVQGAWRTEPYATTPLEEVTDFVVGCDAEIVREKLTTNKRGGCGKCCCTTREGLGDFDYQSDRFSSICPDRNRSVECEDICGCGPDCHNRQVSNPHRKKFGFDESAELLVRNVWGMDGFTRRNVYLSIKRDLEATAKAKGAIEEKKHTPLKKMSQTLEEETTPAAGSTDLKTMEKATLEKNIPVLSSNNTGVNADTGTPMIDPSDSHTNMQSGSIPTPTDSQTHTPTRICAKLDETGDMIEGATVNDLDINVRIDVDLMSEDQAIVMAGLEFVGHLMPYKSTMPADPNDVSMGDVGKTHMNEECVSGTASNVGGNVDEGVNVIQGKSEPFHGVNVRMLVFNGRSKKNCSLHNSILSMNELLAKKLDDKFRISRNMEMKEELNEIKTTSGALMPTHVGVVCSNATDSASLMSEKVQTDKSDGDGDTMIVDEGVGESVPKPIVSRPVDASDKEAASCITEEDLWYMSMPPERELAPTEWDDEITLFIDRILLPFINAQSDAHCHDMSYALKRVIESCDFVTDSRVIRFCYAVLKAIDKYGKKIFKLHPKGTGVICNTEDGLPSNDFIVEFYGEIYTPWRWFEKQDRVKKMLRKGALPDFYNIMLERHRDDGKGYDVLFVDPINKGTYGSRLSHSCDPNCATHVMAVNGKFVIAVYTLKPIKYGEELCFDYNSVTESKEEYTKAVCLCGTVKCRQSFLYYANSATFQSILSVHHNACDRAAIILQASTDPTLSEEDTQRLKRHRFMSSVLNGCPSWLVKFASLILKYIEYERQEMPQILIKNHTDDYGHPYTLESAAVEAMGVHSNREQNLCITLDKIKYILRNQPEENKHNVPLRLHTSAAVADFLWRDKESIIHRTVNMCAKKLGCKDLETKMRDLGKTKVPKDVSEKTIVKIGRKIIMDMRKILLDAQRLCPSARHFAAADCLFLIANTNTFFSSNKFVGVLSEKVEITAADVSERQAPKQATNGKKYSPQHLWGQLHFWDRQTINEPDMSLTAARYGPIVLPELESAYTTGKTYNRTVRKQHFENLKSMRGQQWKCSLPWSYKNPKKMYGSPMMDVSLGYKTLEEYQSLIDDMLSERTTVSTIKPSTANITTMDGNIQTHIPSTPTQTATNGKATTTSAPTHTPVPTNICSTKTEPYEALSTHTPMPVSNI